MIAQARSLIAPLLALVLAAGMASPAGAAPSAPTGSAQWGDCPKTLFFGQVPVPAEMQCALLAVPLDYSRPSGARIHLEAARLPALDASRRTGSLLFAPGGPGFPGVAWLAAEAPRLATLRSRFDLVALDPRGIGAVEGGLSTPSISCQGVPNPEVSPDRFVQSGAGLARLTNANRAFARSCEAGSQGLLAHLGGTNDARDVDAVRQALGEDRVSLFGNSGGTPIMERYAELYAGHVRALYLDSVLDYGAGQRTANLAFATTFESGFQAFVAWCGRSADCALHDRDPLGTWSRVAAAADRQPIPAPRAGTAVGGNVVRAATLVAAIVPSDWVAFSQGVAQAAAGDASWFAAFWPQLFDVPATDLAVLAAQRNILCANGDSRVPDYAALREEQEEARAVAPEIGWFWLQVSSAAGGPVNCQGFPAPVDPPRPVRWRGSFPVLVVNATVDNATPYGLTVAEQRQIPHSVLLTLDRVHGHGAYLSRYSSCTDAAVERYLFDLDLPAAGTVCQPDEPVPAASPSSGPPAATRQAPLDREQLAGHLTIVGDTAAA